MVVILYMIYVNLANIKFIPIWEIRFLTIALRRDTLKYLCVVYVWIIVFSSVLNTKIYFLSTFFWIFVPYECLYSFISHGYYLLVGMQGNTCSCLGILKSFLEVNLWNFLSFTKQLRKVSWFFHVWWTFRTFFIQKFLLPRELSVSAPSYWRIGHACTYPTKKCGM